MRKDDAKVTEGPGFNILLKILRQWHPIFDHIYPFYMSGLVMDETLNRVVPKSFHEVMKPAMVI